MTPGQFGSMAVLIGLIASIGAIASYIAALLAPGSERPLRYMGRGFYVATALSVLTTFGTLAWIVYNRQYQYDYAVQHTGNDISNLWYRFAATWSGQEGSFLLWAAWTSILGFMVFSKAGKYEARVMPFFTSVLMFLCAILIKQTPFARFLDVNHGWTSIPPDGMGLTPSLQNYWMTIHPPTIFFGFSSLAVPFSYAMAAMLWKDYKGWTTRVFPYALLTCATLGLGLFMGGYWAYETLGWHGFWAWDPVENASFFPWLAITALVHGLVVQKSRGGMTRTNTFLGILAFWLFLLGTFLTRSGALASKMPDGQLLSVHAFDNISKSGLVLMTTMLIVYGLGGLVLWLIRMPKMPTRPTTGDSLVSRDFAFFLAIILMLAACAVVTLGSTTPLFLSWMHRPPSAPQASFYNKVMLPLTIIAALALGCVPWLAWKKTDPEKFLRKLMIPWFAMLAFGFFLLFWVQGAERELMASMDPQTAAGTLHDWLGPSVQRVCVVVLASLGCLAALSNAMLAYRVFRAKPLSAGGWLAHVGIGLLIIGVIVSNTYERTQIVTLEEGGAPREVFGYKFSFEGMTGKPIDWRPYDPSYDLKNAIRIRVTPPGADQAASDGSARTFVLEPRWFVHNFGRVAPWRLERMRWPSIQKSLGHDLYIGLADDAQYEWPIGDAPTDGQGIVLKPKQKIDLGPYRIGYFDSYVEPQKLFGVHLVILGPDKQPVVAFPKLVFARDPSAEPGDPPMHLVPIDEAVPELKDENGNPGTVELVSLRPGTRDATFNISLPGLTGRWAVPVSVTYKPWVNMVWIGVLVAVMGTLLAMLWRTIEARKSGDDDQGKRGLPDLELEEEEVPATPRSVPPVPVAPIKSHKLKKANRPPKAI